MSPLGPSGRVQTVLGPIEPESLGVTLTHEHLLIDLACYFQMPDEASLRGYVDRPVTMDMLGKIWGIWQAVRDQQRLLDEGMAIEEILRYRHAGGDSLVDVTSIGIARDPLALARISRATGLHIVMGASHYVPVSHPPDMDARSEEAITEQIVRDVTVGVGDTGVRSGVIGEIGNFHPLSENERKVLRASAHAQIETGAPILIHPGLHPDSPLEIMRELMDAGAEPSRVIVGHLDAIVPLSAITELARMGCYLEYDRFGAESTDFDYSVSGVTLPMPTDTQRMESLEHLIAEGFGDRLLVAHDVCTKADLTRYGGKGYAHFLDSIAGRLRARGHSREQIESILVHNPARALTFA